MDEVDYNS